MSRPLQRVCTRSHDEQPLAAAVTMSMHAGPTSSLVEPLLGQEKACQTGPRTSDSRQQHVRVVFTAQGALRPRLCLTPPVHMGSHALGLHVPPHERSSLPRTWVCACWRAAAATAPADWQPEPRSAAAGLAVLPRRRSLPTSHRWLSAALVPWLRLVRRQAVALASRVVVRLPPLLPAGRPQRGPRVRAGCQGRSAPAPPQQRRLHHWAAAVVEPSLPETGSSRGSARGGHNFCRVVLLLPRVPCLPAGFRGMLPRVAMARKRLLTADSCAGAFRCGVTLRRSTSECSEDLDRVAFAADQCPHRIRWIWSVHCAE